MNSLPFENFIENIPMGDSHFLTIITLLPLLGAAVVWLIRDESFARATAVLIGTITFVLSILLFSQFKIGNSEMQFQESISWLPYLGINYIVGVDALSIWFILLTTFLTFLVLIASGSIHEKQKSYLGCVLLLESGMLGTFVALDVITFYVFWELMLIPMYFLIGVWGHERRIYAALKFFIYTAFGSLLMFVAIVYIAYQYQQQFGTLSFALADWLKIKFTHKEALWLFGAFALAFAIKIPLFPFHTWLPDAHVEAPTGGSVILAGVLLKMGLYGLLRYAVPLFPAAAFEFAPIFAFLGVFGIVYGALVAWVQTDMKKLVAYSSVSHLGFCVLGFAALNFQGVQGCILQMINHGISTGALFFLVGAMYDRKHTREISAFGGIAQKTPVFAALFLIFTLSSIGLPLTNGFVGEFLILMGGFSKYPVLGAVAVSGVVLGAMYMLSLYRRVIFGPLNPENENLADLNATEKLVFAPLLILVFVIGVYPQPLLDVTAPAAEQTVAQIRNRDTYAAVHKIDVPETTVLELAKDESKSRR